MKIIQSPQEYLATDDEIPCFMAGGLQKCDWHAEFLEELQKYSCDKLVIYNPKREFFDMTDSSVEEEQITWEFKYLNAYLKGFYIFSMYFDHSTSPQPICFYELGRYMALLQDSGWNSAVISCHPEFSRKNDVIIQTRLATKSKAKVLECSAAEHAQRVAVAYGILNGIKEGLKSC